MVGGCFLPDFFVRLVDRWLGFSENLVVVAETKRGVLAEFGAGDGSEMPLRLGHQKSPCELEPILRQYRMQALQHRKGCPCVREEFHR